MMGWNYGYSGVGWLGMGLGMIIQLVFWIVIIYIAVRLLRGVTLGRPPEGDHFSSFTASKPNAEDILKQRYAKGEITREQYKEMLKDIKE